MTTIETVRGQKFKLLCEWKPKRSLAAYLELPGKRKELDSYNLLYIIQSKADVDDDVYKIGVSSGYRRLSEYYKHHGTEKNSTSKCTGANLIYLAGTKKPNLNKAESLRLKGYALKKTWSRVKEQAIFKALKKEGFRATRGAEWFHLSGEVGAAKLKKIVLNPETKVENGDILIMPRKSRRITQGVLPARYRQQS